MGRIREGNKACLQALPLCLPSWPREPLSPESPFRSEKTFAPWEGHVSECTSTAKPQAQSLSIGNLDNVRIPFASVLRTKGKQSPQPKPLELWLQARQSRTGLPHGLESSGGLLSVLACKYASHWPYPPG